MPERIIILALVLAGIFLLIKRLFSNTSKGINNSIFDVASTNSSLPTILYFWTEQCTQCFSLQRPALSKLEKEYQGFNLISYNAFNEKEVVKILNIKTVPSTVVISNLNEVRFINNGFASEKLLSSQLKMI